jgi:inward rectifier potassium channel
MKDKPLFKIKKVNNKRALHKDLYHTLLKISWFQLFLTYVGIFILFNTFFALLYLLVPGSLSLENPTFLNAFFFSVQTFSTVGYGIISPVTIYGNMIVVIEIMAGLITTALSTGIIFSRFSKPNAKILYSKNLLINQYGNERVLMFRIANDRSNEIVAASIDIHYTYQETSPEGVSMTRFKPLALQRSYSPLFSLSWTIIHTIDSSSPFFNKSLDEIRKANHEFFIVFTGTDGTYSLTIHDYHTYSVSDIIENKYFVDIVSKDDQGVRTINFKHFHDIRD